jgi:HEPN domain-containing protein
MSVSEDRLKDWIEKADHDLGTAIVINLHIPDYSDTLAFHCQQAVEKCIKYCLRINKPRIN